MKTSTIPSLVCAGVFAFVSIVTGEDNATTNVATTTAQAAQTVTKSEVEKPAAEPKISRSVADVAKLSKAGLEARVIETYLGQSGSTLPPTADEIVYLREQGVSQDVIAALIRRGASVRTQVIQNATKEDRVFESMLDARQRSMFARDYPPVVTPPYIYRQAPPYLAYDGDVYGSPAGGYVYRANPPRRPHGPRGGR